VDDSSPDTVLIARARDGDADAFRAIVERYQASVASTVIGMLGPGPEADDVGQETFIRFFGAMKRFRGDASLKTYLTRIAMNLSLNELKRRKRASSRWLRVDETQGPELGALATTDRPEQPDEALTRSERTRIVRAAIDRLDEKHRSVVVLRLIEGLSTRETSQALDLPQGTVLSRLSRALEKLKTDLEEWIPA
jgi:RNA polymerase sigma-70 factor (ECF subfamily)